MENVVTPDHGRATTLATTLSVLVGWFLLSVWLALHEAFGPPGQPPIGLAFMLLVPLALFAVDSRLRPRCSRGCAAWIWPA